MCAHLDTWPTLSSRFHKADLSESFYIGAEEYKRFLYDIKIDVLNLQVEQSVKPYLKGSAKRLVHKGTSCH